MKKKKKIKSLVRSMLNESCNAMIKNIDKVLDSLDVDSWDENTSPMILPKCIVTAILKRESQQYEGKGTSFQKLVKKQVKEIMYIL